jgi:hypothetical protein
MRQRECAVPCTIDDERINDSPEGYFIKLNWTEWMRLMVCKKTCLGEYQLFED